MRYYNKHIKPMRVWKKIVLGLVFCLFTLVALLFFWSMLQYFRDPLDLINRPVGSIVNIKDSVFVEDFLPADRLYQVTILQTADIGPIHAIISRPAELTETALPVVIILGGLEVGSYTLRYISNPGKNIIIIYHYPYHPTYWYEGAALREIPVIRESVMNVPAQVLTLYQWAGNQAWTDETRMTITGYSFGALFVPAVYHLAELHHIKIKYGVMAYAGADIYHLLLTNMTQVPEPFRSIISWLSFSAIRGIEPALHAPFLRGEFLLINGTRDHQIPKKNWQTLHRLVPEPKTIRILNEGHMHQRNIELTKQLVTISQNWLLERGVINP
jgi:dienelactone hydrolase